MPVLLFRQLLCPLLLLGDVFHHGACLSFHLLQLSLQCLLFRLQLRPTRQIRRTDIIYYRHHPSRKEMRKTSQNYNGIKSSKIWWSKTAIKYLSQLLVKCSLINAFWCSVKFLKVIPKDKVQQYWVYYWNQ